MSIQIAFPKQLQGNWPSGCIRSGCRKKHADRGTTVLAAPSTLGRDSWFLLELFWFFDVGAWETFIHGPDNNKINPRARLTSDLKLVVTRFEVAYFKIKSVLL